MVPNSPFACQDIVYGRKFDHGVRQAAKLGGAPEQVLEQDPVKEAWQKVTVQLAQESEERKASAQTTEDDDAEVGEDEVWPLPASQPQVFLCAAKAIGKR